MSTGDVRRQPSKQTKAVAADGNKPPAKKSSGKLLERPAAATTGTKSGGKAPVAKTTPAKAGGTRPGGGRNRKQVPPVKVTQGRNWGPIALFGGAGLVAVLIIGFGAFQVYKETNKGPWKERAAAISGINQYLTSNPDWFVFADGNNHKPGVLTYPMDPPAGGVHNPVWQNCMGDVYTSEISKEQATHSMEHGAVWVTYRPDLPADQVEALASKVRDKPFLLMSPYPGLDKPISLQAWGYQLKVDNADDDRIDEFIGALAKNATQEPQAVCSGGITDTGSTPLDMVDPAAAGG